MTLVIAAVNPHFAVQVSDRRLTSVSGNTRIEQVAHEEFGKALVWFAPNGRFIFGFTGVTQTSATRGTLALLAAILSDIAAIHEYNAERMLESLASALDTKVREKFSQVPMEHRRLTFIASGFLDDADGNPHPVMVLFTNFQVWGDRDDQRAWSHFTTHWLNPLPEADWPTVIQRVGAWPAVGQNDVELIRDLLAFGKPPRASIGKIVEMFPGFAAQAGGSVGSQLSSVSLSCDPAGRFGAAYHTAAATDTQYGVSQVITFPDNNMAMLQPEIRAVDGIAAVPKSHASAPCQCGSGKTYGDCHGRFTEHP